MVSDYIQCTVTLCLSNVAPSLPPLITLCVSFLTDTWTPQETTGDKPPRLYGHTLSMIGQTKAALFGGYDWRNWHNDAYILDMDTWV